MSDTTTPDPSAAAVLAGNEQPFYSGFQDEGAKTFAQGFKTSEELAAFGAKFSPFKDVDPSRLVALPGEDADEAARAALYDKLGRPKEPSEYGLTKIEGVNADMAKAIEAAFHANGVSKAQAEKIAQTYVGLETQALEAEQSAARAAATAEVAQVRTEIGEAGIESARRVAIKAGFTKEELANIEGFVGAGAILRRFAALGKLIGEHNFEGGAKQQGNPQSALERLYPNDVAKDRANRGG